MSHDLERCEQDRSTQTQPEHWAGYSELEVHDLLSSLVHEKAAIFAYHADSDCFRMLKGELRADAPGVSFAQFTSFELVDRLCSGYIARMGWKRVSEFLSQEHIALCMEHGVRQSISVPLDADGCDRDWMKLTLFPSSLSQQKAFLMVELMDRRERLYPIFEFFIRNTSACAYVIELETGWFFQLMGDEKTYGGLSQEGGDYWQETLRYIERCVPEAERQVALRRMNPEHILHKLQENPEYSFVMNELGEDGETRAMQVTYRALDMERGFVLLRRKDVTDARLKEQMLEQAQHESVTDPLTQVNNRRGSESKIQEALLNPEGSRESALVLLDLDSFKDVNDRFGHPEGDRVLQEAARRLQGCLRSEDFVGRLGGDEFIVFLQNIAGLDNLHVVLERVIRALRIDCGNESERAVVTASVGVALCGDKTYEELYREADRALYQAKTTKDGYSIYGEIA